MKTKYILRNTTTAVLALLLSGCVAEDVTESKPSSSSNGKVMKFSAIMENNDSDITRTALGTDGKTVLWQHNDQIKVFNTEITNAIAPFTNEAEEASSSTDFTGTISADADGNGDFYALYPYQESATYTDDVLTAELPAIQTATTGSFDPAAQLMTAHTGATYFKFKNVVALIKVTIKSSTSDDGFQIGAIRFTANKSTERIAGGFTASIDVYGVPTVTANNVSTGSQSVVLKVDDNGKKLDDGTYYIAVLPSTYSTGFTISLEDTRSGHEKIYTRRRSSAYTINRSDIINMGKYSTTGSSEDIANGYTDATSGVIEDAVDLGLPSGTLWCTKNVGASTADTYGKYYAWAEDFAYGENMTSNNSHSGKYYEPNNKKTIYSWAYYKFGYGQTGWPADQNNFSDGHGVLGKYNSYNSYGEIDNLTELETSDDPAYNDPASIKNNVHTHIMPTNTQREELLKYCDITYTTYLDGSVKGFKLTSKVAGYTNKYIFIPAGGYYMYNTGDGDNDTPLRNSTTNAYLWTKTRASAAKKSYQARCLDIKYNSGNIDTSNDQDDRHPARNIRPVINN